jgi:hypothetical protein
MRLHIGWGFQTGRFVPVGLLLRDPLPPPAPDEPSAKGTDDKAHATNLCYVPPMTANDEGNDHSKHKICCSEERNAPSHSGCDFSGSRKARSFTHG